MPLYISYTHATLDELRGHSTPYRIALVPHAGRKVITLQTLPSSGEFAYGAARANGFSRHAGVVTAADNLMSSIHVASPACYDFDDRQFKNVACA